MQAGRWNATESIGTTFLRIWRVVFWESEFFEKASQKKKKKKTRSHLEKKKRFHNTCLINQTGIIFLWTPQTGSRFHTFCCGFSKVACFWSNFRQYNVLAIYPWNPKQRRRSKKNSNVADSATNLIFACCGIHLQLTKCTVWPRNDFARPCSRYFSTVLEV